MTKTGSRNRETAEAPSLWWNRSQQLLVATAVALVVAAVLIPSESAVPLGTHVVVVMGWLLVATLSLVRCLMGLRRRWQVGATEVAVVLFLLAHSASAWVMLRAGHARLTLNALWLWIAFGMLFLSVRYLFGQAREQRALVSAIVALAAGLSAFGLYQVSYSDPRMRAEYARDPEAALREAGVDAPPGSPQRQQFENRLASREPIGSFALTNSLAGLLAPSLVLLLFLVGSFRDRSPGGWPYALNMVLPVLVVAGCLVLTKSRSAYGAVLVGGVLATALCTVPRRWFRWPVLLGALGVVIALTVLAVRWGGLDRQVITEAPKSLTYRLEYWRATGAMMVDYPWFGCGPGNFKSFYTRYKLPEASETIADPHNFLLEIGATAGLPALALYLSLAVAGLVDLWRRQKRANTPATGSAPDPERASAGAAPGTVYGAAPGTVYAGVLAGFVAAYPAGWAGGIAPDLALLWVAGPAVAGTLWMLHAWVLRGSLPPGPLVVAGVVLLVNLLAAGGIGFPGVGQFVWLFAALALNAASADRALLTFTGRGCAGWMAALVVAGLVLVGSCYVTMYRPVLAARQELDRAREAASESGAQRALDQAVAADPWWAEPWEFLAELAARQWMADPTDQHLAEFVAARDNLLARDHNSSRVCRRCGDWLLEMFAASGRADLGAEAIQAYTQAVALYPRSGILHAQLAWAGHVTGDQELARQHADEALRLDALMPHREFKLAHQRLIGDYLAETGPPSGAEHPTEDAEHLMQRVRKVKNR